MKILAFDLGTYCGWASSDGAYGELDLRTKRWESSGMLFHKFRKSLPDLGPADLVAYERVTFGKGREVVVMQGLTAILLEWCEAHGIEYTGVHVSTLKKWTTGKGNSKKEAMRASLLLEDPSLEGATHNEIDAIALLRYARHHYEPRGD